MDFGNLIQQAALLAIPLILAITLSEAARGHMAYWQGDKTGWSQGRHTWNPANHIAPIETIVIPMALFFLTSGAFIFGSAKPVPIDYRNLRGHKQGAIWVEMASPIALFVMALLWYIALAMLTAFGVQEVFFIQSCKAGVMVCLSLFAFQLLPVPPLAGGRILLFALPPKYGMQLARIEPWSMWIILALAFFQILGPIWMTPIRNLALAVLQLLTTPLIYLFN
ncbi:site-2 protease family protein [Rhodoferax sp. AJA081-3]|uniref:site-2 protease family protein n=1 Tax=Rhodoferax sp. AJA081-3 TaxID=2752316 RepID=UPI001AE02E96|nr:site-2 protease family protein [Rhodoferax sp. AJA081-3]QTN27817.1 site-2 protease family protein [Rhodoferax sp. AJA081-3]